MLYEEGTRTSMLVEFVGIHGKGQEPNYRQSQLTL